MLSRKSALPLLLAAALALGLPGLAGAATAPVSDPHILTHFDQSALQMPENIALEPDGSIDLSLSYSDQLARVDRTGHTTVLATLPAPADGGVNTPFSGQQLITGLVRAWDGTLYTAYSTGTADLTGIWRLPPGGAPSRVAALPTDTFANGMALDELHGLIYATDSARSLIWRIPLHGGAPTVWARTPELSGTADNPFGANGLKLHNGALWASNMAKGTLVRYPVDCHGQAGDPQVRATGLTSIDDFAFTGQGDTLLATLNPLAEVALVRPDGSHTIVLTAADGLTNPTSVAVRGGTVYVTDAAYGGTDPNLLTAHLSH
ncbi:hypothetical protein CFP65_7585 [Kitasatospora sp. MMS16-BH015]|uniref:SMP-30/gluconolactonase/LRE family protein n=1 Tax=Kitasatospora sp. MMS16-BH015 TaxID=2018025 RepID=UPI000CA220EF|nr:hypothetical protein [Kitasatospora sp. MMS16-BH015]AUG82156.1 hypothetical protein CFP65_7585 [Kitasatospora sp. MMS16-BH015]